MSRVTTRRATLRITADRQVRRPDTLAVEEPLELRVDGQPLTVTMRTPGNDVDLAHGFLLSENIIGSAQDIVSARYCAGADRCAPGASTLCNHLGFPDSPSDTTTGQNTYNILDIELRTPTPISARNVLTTSACGLCGRTTLDEVRTRTRYPLPAHGLPVDPATLAGLPSELRDRQKVFDATGGLHAAGLFTAEGEAVAVREDVGRHNAVDKVIGWALRENRIPAHDLVLIVSGRASFELVQKAVMAGIPMLGAVSAPSSLAVDLALETGLTLVGFLRGDTMNVYSAPERLTGIPLTAHAD
jgi:FdhD protein